LSGGGEETLVSGFIVSRIDKSRHLLMSFKTTYILFCVLVAMLGLFGLMLLFKGAATDPGFVLPSFHAGDASVNPDTIDRVEVERKRKKTVAFVHDKQGWHLEKPRVRLEPYRIMELIREVSQARREEDTDVTSDLARYGLEKPDTVVTLQKGNEEWQLRVGRQSPEKEGVVYVTSSERPREVLAVRRSELSNVLDFNLDNYRKRKLLDANPTSTVALTLTEGKKPKVKELALKKGDGGTWKFLVPRGYGPAEMEGGDVIGPPDQQKVSPGVRGLLQALDTLQVEGFEPLDRSPASYGLQPGGQALRIDVVNSDGDLLSPGKKNRPTTETLLVGKKGTRQGKTFYYVRMLNEQAVVRVDEKNLQTAFNCVDNPEILRSLRLTEVDPATVDALTIDNASGQIRLRRASPGGNRWRLDSKATKLRDADARMITELLTALGAPHQIKKFMDDSSDKALGLDRPDVTVSLWVGGLAPPEKEEAKPAKDDKAGAKKAKTKKAKKEVKKAPSLPPLRKSVADKSTVRLSFGYRDNDLVYVKREVGGEVNRVAVPLALRDKVIRGPLSYLNRTLKPLPLAEVTGFELTRGKVVYQVSRVEKTGAWKFARAKGATTDAFADRENVSTLLATLSGLHVLRWENIGPARGELKKYGLDQPALQAEVTVKPKDGKSETRLYAFGKEIEYEPGTRGVYALAGGDVFLTNPAQVKTLQEIELRDRTVFSFSPAKVTEIKLEGWDNPAEKNQYIRLELKRADNAWKLTKGPEGFQIDEQSVEPLLGRLANLKLSRFVPGDAEAGFLLGTDKAGRYQGPVHITITVAGRKKPHELTIGKRLPAEPLYHAQSDTLGKDVFLMPAGPVEPLLNRPNKAPWFSYFKRKIE
jgi:hypothetical protein